MREAFRAGGEGGKEKGREEAGIHVATLEATKASLEEKVKEMEGELASGREAGSDVEKADAFVGTEDDRAEEGDEREEGGDSTDGMDHGCGPVAF